MARADVLVAQGTSSGNMTCQSAYMVKLIGSLYVFWQSAVDNSLYYSKSTDRGLTWGMPVQIRSGNMLHFAIWYDAWTPGDSGTKVHIVYTDQTPDDVFYRSLDTADDSLSTEVTIVALASTGASANTCISVTKAIGGNLYCLFDIDGGTETGFYRSTDAGASWASRTNTAEGADYFLLAPGFAADTQDIICIFWDRSASEISRKLYDDSANSWAETSIATSMTAIPSGNYAPQFALTVDDANNKILLVAWSAGDTLNADLRFWTIDESSITEGTNVVQDSVDDQGLCAIALDTRNNILYVFYGGKSDGSETMSSSINIYYKISSDGGATWGAETLLSSSARDYRGLHTSPLFAGPFVAQYEAISSFGTDALVVSALLPQQQPVLALGMG